jgi:hypothetical protein
MQPKGYTLIRCGLTFNVFRVLIFLDGDKSPAAILAFPQITFFFRVANPAGNIKLYLKTGFVTAMWTKFGRHGFSPFSPVIMPGEQHGRLPGVLNSKC